MSQKTKTQRISFASSKILLEYPDLLEVQLKSFRDFFQLDTTPENRKNEGLYQVFQEIFPIEDTRNNYKLEFIDYFIDPPQYSIDECLERGLTYNVPLKAKLRLSCSDPDLRHQRIRKNHRIPAAQVSGRILRPEPPCQRDKTVFCSNHPVQGIMDRVCDGHQQCDVRIHRP